VERIDAGGTRGELWVKRDDLNAPEFGGNKVRSLEFLLANVAPGDVVLTLGGEGSTHVLATAAHARRLGATTRAVRWRHEMSPIAAAVAEQARALCARLTTLPDPLTGMLAAALLRLTGGARYVPLGGSTPLGILGHVNGALELAEQVAGGALPRPARVVVPLGSGGTAAGLALGFWIAGLDALVVGARVAPRVGSNRWRVMRLARATAALIARATGEPVSAPPPSRVEIVHDVYGGAYGRTLPAAQEAATLLRRTVGVHLDGTYGAKAFAAALRIARRTEDRTLFWVTFDGRWMEERA
jgi:D-cysteine desulfhydrase